MAPSQPVRRRDFLALAAGAAGALVVPQARAAPTDGKIRAIAFDAFTTFDARPLNALAEELFPGNGAALMNAWRTRQFEYTWLRTLAGNYLDFWHVTSDALLVATKLLKLDTGAGQRDRLMQQFLELKAWPDALPALTQLKASGLKLAFLANPTVAMLDRWVANSGLEGLFEPHLSTDRVRAFKPDPRAYRMGTEAFGLPPSSIVFAAFGGWDAAGAKAFGYPTFWVNRAAAPAEELGFAADGSGSTLADLAAFVFDRR